MAAVSLCESASPVLSDQLKQTFVSTASQGLLQHEEEPSSSTADNVEESTQNENQLHFDRFRLLQATPSPSYLASVTYNTALNLYSNDSLTYFTQTYNSTTSITTFEHGRIDSSQPGNIMKYYCTLSSSYKSKVKSPYLGCSMAYSSSLATYAFISFNGSALKVLTQIAKINLPVDLSPYNVNLLNNNTYLSEDCRFLSVNSNNYYLKGNSMIKLNMPAVNYTNTSMHAYQDSVYFLASNHLYKFHFVQNYLQAKYLLPYPTDSSYGWQYNAYQNRFAISSQKKISTLPLKVLTTLYIVQ